MTIEPALRFVEHDDVVFGKAPLEAVLCQIRFPPIFALMDQAGVSGFQEALRRDYPETSAERQVEFSLAADNSEVRQKAPVWRLRDASGDWTVSVAVDFVALETPAYPEWSEFRARLEFILAAANRTLNPARASRVGLRKINLFSSPNVTSPNEWNGYLRPELLGLAGMDLPGNVKTAYSEVQIADASNGTLTARFGPDPQDSAKFRLDLDYWTERYYKLIPGSALVDRVEAYSHAITSFFHWSLEPSLYQELEPRPRVEGAAE